MLELGTIIFFSLQRKVINKLVQNHSTESCFRNQKALFYQFGPLIRFVALLSFRGGYPLISTGPRATHLHDMVTIVHNFKPMIKVKALGSLTSTKKPTRLRKVASMSRPLLYPFYLLFCFFSLLSGIQSADLQILMKLKSTLLQTSNAIAFISWESSNSMCNFTGINCNSGGFVTEIELSYQNLTGILPLDSICLLQSLEKLSFGFNYLHGPIMDDLKNCVKLQYLDLGNNLFTGWSVPEISSLSQLRYLHLNLSGFSGTFPWKSLQNMTNLGWLSLGDNPFNPSPFPNEVFLLTNLTWLYLSNCGIQGTIPAEIGNLKELINLELADNNMTGKTPVEIGNLVNLWQLELYNNSFTGKLPIGLRNLTKLEIFDFSNNYLEGDLSELRFLNNLVSLQLYQNELSGQVPAEFSNFTKLVDLSLYRNSFTGPLPHTLLFWAKTNFIEASENFFTGPIPPDMCKQGTMKSLIVSENYLTGEIPASYANCSTLNRFRANNNSLSGKVPIGIWGLPNMDLIDISLNDIEGPITSDIKNAKSLTYIFAGNNHLSGELPAAICNRVFAMEGAVNAGYGVIGQSILLLRNAWVLQVFKEQSLILAVLLGLSAFFSMAGLGRCLFYSLIVSNYRLCGWNSVSFVRGQNGISEDYLWQSFDYLSHTLLEGMKCEWDLRRSLTLNRHLLAWKNWFNGDFILRVNFTTNKQHFSGKGMEHGHKKKTSVIVVASTEVVSGMLIVGITIAEVGNLYEGYITLGLGLRLSALFALGAGQGLIGWWMVKSGLEEPASEYAQPRVSPYRLAAHLTSAFAIYCGLFWTALSVVMPEPPAESVAWVRGAAKVKRLALPVGILVAITAVSGAFVAGNDAGHAYNTFPKMGDTWIPEDVLDMKPLIRNFFENTSTVQLDHRILATATLISIGTLWWSTRKLDIHPAVKSLIGSTIGMAALQVTLGISTLLSYVPVSLGTAHQAGALTLLTLMILLNHTVRRPSMSLLKSLPQVAKTT
nr:cytochrome c oxidase assembly protein cox15 [Quercus suber]